LALVQGALALLGVRAAASKKNKSQHAHSTSSSCAAPAGRQQAASERVHSRVSDQGPRRAGNFCLLVLGIRGTSTRQQQELGIGNSIHRTQAARFFAHKVRQLDWSTSTACIGEQVYVLQSVLQVRFRALAKLDFNSCHMLWNVTFMIQ